MPDTQPTPRPPDKELRFAKPAIEALREFPDEVRRKMGTAIRLAQQGVELIKPRLAAAEAEILAEAEAKARSEKGSKR